MESRNISLTLEKAREWYNSGNEALKEAALQAYTKEELIIPKFTNIKTFEDACRALGVSTTSCIKVPCTANKELIDHLRAIYKLDIIHKALNEDWNPNFTEGYVYCPYIRIYPSGEKAQEVASSYNWELGETFKSNGQYYTLVKGNISICAAGLIYFDTEHGIIHPHIGLFGCKSREIAEHMSRYFSKEIFEATYAHYIGMYQWV